MKLLSIPPSPFVRKVRVAAHELGLADQLEVEPVETSPMDANPRVTAENPLGRVPTLLRDDGPPLYESGVICEYLDSLVPEITLFPMTGERRWASRRLHALADGLAQEGVTLRREESRPAELQWTAFREAFAAKLTRTHDRLESEPDLFEAPLDIGQIALGAALGWLTFREVGPPIFDGRPRLAAWYAEFVKRPSMQASVPG
jgi:glutathione S-transferase